MRRSCKVKGFAVLVRRAKGGGWNVTREPCGKGIGRVGWSQSSASNRAQAAGIRRAYAAGAAHVAFDYKLRRDVFKLGQTRFTIDERGRRQHRRR